MHRYFFLLFIQIFCGYLSLAKTLHVGKSQPYQNINAAAKVAVPGDVILVHNGTYPGNQSIDNLQGTRTRQVIIKAEKIGSVIIDGGGTALQGNDLAWVTIEGFIFTRQTDNGVNFSDGGSYATPTHHLTIKNCAFHDMAATGNNDQLKLSGVDDFVIENCSFLNGAKGGSGIDMVGCHHGLITRSRYENLGDNAIQMKGGSSHIRVEGCFFKNAGQRAINLGGSTGLPFFRPIDVTWEASDLKIYSNVFIGSDAAVAFVGCTRSEVVNNTIYKPQHWVLRILQENRDTVRFVKSGHNIFSNNAIVIDDKIRVVCNVGGSTLPQTFSFSNNSWYHTGTTLRSVQLPVTENNSIIGKDPLFKDATAEEFSIGKSSPLAGAGAAVSEPKKDYSGKTFATKRAIGAFNVE